MREDVWYNEFALGTTRTHYYSNVNSAVTIIEPCS